MFPDHTLQLAAQAGAARKPHVKHRDEEVLRLSSPHPPASSPALSTCLPSTFCSHYLTSAGLSVTYSLLPFSPPPPLSPCTCLSRGLSSVIGFPCCAPPPRQSVSVVVPHPASLPPPIPQGPCGNSKALPVQEDGTRRAGERERERESVRGGGGGWGWGEGREGGGGGGGESAG